MKVAFTDIANPGWTAGSIYYRNLLVALHALGEARPHLDIVVEPHQLETRHGSYRGLADHVLEVPRPPRTGRVERYVRRVKRRLHRPDPQRRPIEQVLVDHGVDVLFGCWTELGPGFAVPLLGWIPDFQHVHHPELFDRAELDLRDDLFVRMAANCTRIVLSSEDARQDFERFSPEQADKARVLRFVAQVPDGVYDHDPAEVCRTYHLPERFVYLPNQFWVHKNHAVVVDALDRLRDEHPAITVVCTGNPADNREPLHFGELMAEVSRRGLRDTFVVLGWVPHAHTFHLLRQSLAVLQPSRFEGWSTTVEETRSIGKSIVLSDIPIHREQNPPGSRWFDPDDPDALAEHLVRVYDELAPGPDLALETAAVDAMPERTSAYADRFVEIAAEVALNPGARPAATREARTG